MSTNELPSDTVIWHYMDLKKLESVLENKFFFRRPFTFSDKWEGRFPPSYARNIKEFEDEFEDEFTNRAEIHRYAQFVSCWQIRVGESDSMWRLYAAPGVAIQSTIGSVMNCLLPHRGEAVQYYDPSKDVKSEGVFGTADILFKRESFSAEREFRIWSTDDELLEQIERGERVNESNLSEGKLFNITNLTELVKKLVVAPGADDAFIKLVKDSCAAHGKTLLASRIERSSLGRSWDSFAK